MLKPPAIVNTQKPVAENIPSAVQPARKRLESE